MQSQLPTGPPSDLLFQEDDLIRSVLDLTRQLKALGMIEVFPQPNGSEYYRIIVPKKSRFGARKSPAGELARRVGAIFGRKADTHWQKDEIDAFKTIEFDLEDLLLVEGYYRSEAKKENSYCRTALLTFLRHYSGEIDRARRWKINLSKRHCY